MTPAQAAPVGVHMSHDDVVAFWSFDDCTAKDSGAHGLNGKVMGQPRCVDGARGKALSFNPAQQGQGPSQPTSGDYIALPPLPAWWEHGMSVCLWAQPLGPALHFQRFVDLNDGVHGEAGGFPVVFGRFGVSDDVVFESWVSLDPNDNRARGRLIAPQALANAKMRFYCATTSRLGQMRIYIDGAQVAESNGHPAANVTRRASYIGHSSWTANDPDFTGIIDDVRLYRRALEPHEIAQLYRTETP